MNNIYAFVKNIKNGTIRTLFTCLFLWLFVSSSSAQFFDEISNPQVSVRINHAPGLGFKINKIAFNTATGTCSDEVITALIGDFVNSKIEVLDRENLKSILAEHDLNFSGYLDQNKAVEIGKIIGPSALITVKVLRCQAEIKDNLYANETKYDAQTKQNYNVVAYIARTRFYLKVSIQTADLTTGRIFTARVLDYSPVKENKSYEGRPEAPAEFDVREEAFTTLVQDVHRMFLPWSETTSLYYFDDKDGNLKQAYLALQSGAPEIALDYSLKNLEDCKNTLKIKDKTLAHAYYNLGMSYFIINEYDKAIVNFLEAQKIKPGNIINQAISNCQYAKNSSLAMQKVDENAKIEADKVQEQEANAVKTEIANTLTNADIIDLTNKKLPKNIILTKIKNSKCKFDTSTEALVALTKAGVDEEVVMVMMEKK
jgi:tetratricopeptide (TPR) repeat protein